MEQACQQGQQGSQKLTNIEKHKQKSAARTINSFREIKVLACAKQSFATF